MAQADMQKTGSRATDACHEPRDSFSLAIGGPLFDIWRRAKLSGEALELLRRRIVATIAVAWLPLLILSLLEGTAWSANVAPTFLGDVETQVRLLIAIPVLLAADAWLHQRVPGLVQLFVVRDLVPAEALPQFRAAIESAVRLRNSKVAELLLVSIVYGIGVAFLWRTRVALDVSSWYGVPIAGRLDPSLAGWWMGCVSLPIFQFLVLRWYFRLFVWARFLWQVSRIKLRIVPTHPDASGGLGFLTGIGRAFGPVLFAQGTVMAGMIANRIFYTGAELMSFKVEVAGSALLLAAVVLAPLLVFTPQLASARRAGQRDYGSLAQRYMSEFDRKWVRGAAAPDEPLVGSADVQSLADMGGGYELVRNMQLTPISYRAALKIALIPVLPCAPLLLTTFSPEQLLERVLTAIF